MPNYPRLSLRLHGGLTPQQCVAQAQVAEAAGFHGIWFAENPFNRGILPAAAACALATRKIKIAPGVFNPYNRHPTLIAMEIGALDELAQGRVRLGIGSGIGTGVERMGFAYDRPLTTLREAVVIVRALLRGDEMSHTGRAFQINKVKLDYRPRADIPVFMAGRGDRSLRVCGELGDGLIVSNMCTVAFTAGAIEKLHAAARAAGRGLPEVVQYVACFPGADRKEAQRLARAAVGDMLPGYWRIGQRQPAAKRALIEGSGIGEADFAAAVARLAAGERAETALDERFAAAFTLAGNVDDCRRQAAAYAKAGVTELALTFAGPDAAADMQFLKDALS
ncbi:MAG: LLM class flavin-dependent oxidoreductase [Bradyrhizobiaceae bacterium]|nr:LLM class flavin-dependent oxidoreductase [Bradyrhizobiaceae bacterium]